MIDNTPPILTIGEVRRTGATAHVEWEAADAPAPCAAANTRSTPTAGCRWKPRTA